MHVRVCGAGRDEAELVEMDVTAIRADIATRYLWPRDGVRFADGRRSKPGVLLLLRAAEPRVRHLTVILPS